MTTSMSLSTGLLHSTIYDALIVGAGPAGLSAALALGRVNRSALVFDSGVYRNDGAAAMHTVLSRDGTAPDDYRRIARQQIEDKYKHIAFRAQTVVQLAKTDIDQQGYQGFQATDDASQSFRGRRLVLATGTQDVLPDIPGYRENWLEHM